MKKGLSVMEKKTISEKAGCLLSNFGYISDRDTYIDVTKLANRFGFKVGESSQLPFIEDGFISISQDKEELIIGVNIDRTLEEKRFIVAHEIGHYYLHYENSTLESAVMHREHIKGKNQRENDADFFAACLLMPADSFSKQYTALKAREYSEEEIIDTLQSIYITPRESIIRRIKEVCNGRS